MPNKITGASDIIQIADSIRYQNCEYWIVLYLDQTKTIQAIDETSLSQSSTSQISPLQIIQAAIQYSSTSIVLIHNQPSGDVSPNPKDIAYTRKIAQIAKILGIKLVDHIIVTENEYYSFFEEGVV